MEENIPPCTPPWDSMPWYMTAFQSSPVRICGADTESTSPAETGTTKKHIGADLYLEDGENGCWECVKVGCRRFVFKIKPAGRKQSLNVIKLQRHRAFTRTQSSTSCWIDHRSSPLGPCTLLQHNTCH